MRSVHNFSGRCASFLPRWGCPARCLIAHPNLLDPNFRRSVLIISASDPQEGSFGLMLNRATEKTVGELLPEHELGLLESCRCSSAGRWRGIS